MADKKGLPELLSKGISTDISRRNFGRGLTGIATQIATGPLLDRGISAISGGTPPAIKEAIPLLTEFFNIKSKITNLQSKIWGDRKYGTKEFEDAEAAQFYYNKLIEYKNNQKHNEKILSNIEDMMKSKNIDTENFDPKDEDIIVGYENIMDELAGDQYDLDKTSSTIKDLPKKSQNYIKKLTEYKNDQNTIRILAEEKKVPFNYFSRFVSNELQSGPITKESIKKAIDKQVSQRTPGYIESVEKIKNLSTPAGFKEEIEEELKFWKMSKEGGLKGWKNSTRNMTPQQADDWQREQIKESKFKTLTNLKHVYESNQNLKSRDFKGFESVSDMTWDYDDDNVVGNKHIGNFDRDSRPSERKNLFKEIGEEIFSAAGKVVKDQSINAGKKILNKIIEKVQEPSKQNTKVTPKKTLSIEKLPGKGKIIDVESTKTEIKEPVKPKRNLAQDLVGGIGKRLKYSPIGAALYTTEVGDAELPLETSPRGYGVRRENKGRSSKDPNKTYNTQRFI